jgi:hypothetical protein
VTFASLSLSLSEISTLVTLGVVGAGVGVTADGRTVTSGIPRRPWTSATELAKAVCVAVPSAARSTMSVSTPLSRRTARRAATSLPS